MTDRKPPGVSWESWVDRQVREARERGEFDNLPGHGKPIADIDRPRDEMWWVRQKLAREDVTYTPPTLAIRKELQDTLIEILDLPTEQRVRDRLAELNTKIRKVNSTPSSGPPSSVMPVDIALQVARWRERRDAC